jgi:hypothetical protein
MPQGIFWTHRNETGNEMYTVTLFSKFTKMVLMIESIKAGTKQEAVQIALGCMAHPEAWTV